MTGPTVYDAIEQGTPEWAALRCGVPTASQFHCILAKGQGKTRTSYMRQLAGEIITGSPADTYTNADMARGHEMEPDARDLYAFLTDADPQQVGFILNGKAGCSPDGLVGSDGMVEIKSKKAALLIECFERGSVCPPEHMAQCQGALWVAEREWIDFVAYWPKMPLFVVRVTRDKDYIANLSGEVDRFNDELAMLVDRIRAYGGAPVLREQLEASAEAA